jgi:hypothetical protein
MGAIRFVTLISTVTAGALACSLAAPISSDAATTKGAPGILHPAFSSAYRHAYELDNRHDRTYNILSGISKTGRIVGFYGRGNDPGHPSKGYMIRPPYRQSDYKPENYPHSRQTQVLGMSNNGYIVGTFSYTNRKHGDIWYGFWARNGHFHKVTYPGHRFGNNQLTGINDKGFAVGAYIDTAGRYHPFRYNIFTHSFSVPVAGGGSVTASSINDKGTIVGFFRKSSGRPWVSYVTSKGRVLKFTVPVAGAKRTEAQGLNDRGVIVGLYTWANKVYGFVRSARGRFKRYKFHKGLGFDSINIHGDVVGWYLNGDGQVNGILLVP